jgi:hypothetical protein
VGLDGSSSLVNVTNLIIGDENCPTGGIKLDFGVDLNTDGMLSSSEISSTAFVCNGLDGKDGEDGTSALVEVTAISVESSECLYGGVLVTNGYDLNGNGTLEGSEIAGTTIVCNGTNGTNGTDGTDGTDGV